MSYHLLANFGDESPAAFERERRGFAGPFEIYADRKAQAFVMLRCGLSHKGGSVQHILSAEEAELLGRALLNAAKFATTPMLADKGA